MVRLVKKMLPRLTYQVFWMETLGENWQKQTVLWELLVEREVLRDPQFFMELFELFLMSPSPTETV